MKNRFVVVLAGLFLGVLSACGPSQTEQEQPAPAPEQQQLTSVEPFMCPVCPVMAQAGAVNAQAQGRPAVKDEVSGLYRCPPCEPYGYCGDGYCGFDEDSYSCPYDCGNGGYCGDGWCNSSIGESSYNCSADCGSPPYCGDGICNGNENYTTCGDCPPPSTWCGDGICNGGEDSWSCPGDCGSGGYCGDGFCEYPETRYNCRADCYYRTCLVEPCPIEP